jgi:PPP family 3-phenylpropionic acid transporter
MNPGQLPYWRLSGFYAFYFAMVGTMVPFLGLWLQSLDFSPEQIGIVASTLMLTRLVAPNVWGWLADRSGRRLWVIRLGSLMAAICFGFLFWRQDFWWVAVVFVAFSFFWNAVLAQFEVITLNYLGGRPHFYSRIRLWGSVGFILVVVLLGVLFDLYSVAALPWVGMAFLIAIWLSALALDEPQSSQHEQHQGEGFLSVALQKPVLCFLMASLLLQLSHGSYYTFYSVFLESLNYSRTSIGVLWALGVVAEVLVFWYMHHVMKHIGPRAIFQFSLAMAVLRWFLIGCFPEHLLLMVFAQVLHAFTFGSAHSVAIELVRRYFPGRIQGQGQALYSAASFGAGGALGALISGYLWSSSPVLSFAVSCFASALALGLVWWGMRGPLSANP